MIRNVHAGAAARPALDIYEYGPAIPPNGTQGFSPGALFYVTEGVIARQSWFRNDGTTLACQFNPVEPDVDLSPLLASAEELNRLADRDNWIVTCTDATLAITEDNHDGRLVVLDRADGIAVTLPTAAAGLRFRFIIKTTFTGAATIKSATGADIMIGHAVMGNDTNNTIVNWQATAADTFDTIDMLGTANSTGGMAGQEVEIIGLAANLWYVKIIGDAAGTEATPFANTVA